MIRKLLRKHLVCWLTLKEKLASASTNYEEAILLKANAERTLKNVKVALDVQEVELRKKLEDEGENRKNLKMSIEEN